MFWVCASFPGAFSVLEQLNASGFSPFHPAQDVIDGDSFPSHDYKAFHTWTLFSVFYIAKKKCPSPPPFSGPQSSFVEFICEKWSECDETWPALSLVPQHLGRWPKICSKACPDFELRSSYVEYARGFNHYCSGVARKARIRKTISQVHEAERHCKSRYRDCFVPRHCLCQALRPRCALQTPVWMHCPSKKRNFSQNPDLVTPASSCCSQWTSRPTESEKRCRINTPLDPKLWITHFAHWTVTTAQQQVGISQVSAIEAWQPPHLWLEVRLKMATEFKILRLVDTCEFIRRSEPHMWSVLASAASIWSSRKTCEEIKELFFCKYRTSKFSLQNIWWKKSVVGQRICHDMKQWERSKQKILVQQCTLNAITHICSYDSLYSGQQWLLLLSGTRCPYGFITVWATWTKQLGLESSTLTPILKVMCRWTQVDD